MAIQTYSTGDPADAIDLVEVAQNAVGLGGTPRVRAMLHAASHAPTPRPAGARSAHAP
ncbi:hypothetical protein [Streptomyces sp. NPDC002671]